MMYYELEASYLEGKLTLPLSKSRLHRLLLAEALACRQVKGSKSSSAVSTEAVTPALAHVEISPVLRQLYSLASSEDLQATRRAVEALLSGGDEVDCGESGTTLRLFLPIAMALGRRFRLTGRGRLPERSLKAYRDLFAWAWQGERLPIQLDGELVAGDYEVDVSESSQFASGLLMALPLLEGDSVLRLKGELVSAPYLELTQRILEDYGLVLTLEATADGRLYRIPGGQSYRSPAKLSLEADPSQAVPFLLANFLGHQVELPVFSIEMPDGKFGFYLEALQAMRDGQSNEAGLSVDVRDCPDSTPALAFAMATTRGRHWLNGVERLRLKESDRLASLLRLLEAFSVPHGLSEEGLWLEGRPEPLAYLELEQGTAQCLTMAKNQPSVSTKKRLPLWFEARSLDLEPDHRLVMLQAILALNSVGETKLRQVEALKKSYPQFLSDLEALGAKLSKQFGSAEV